ncbi:FtsK/SpoIIIE family DNA translocase [Clostridium perfringens]|uniref:FtsK/SpoIIIE family DNA translocase n=1 Tax=Clostridium perfringens TaxID=1502 RepID=UPI0018E47BD8|nr:DNA translocase FtsK [Clostridium perfringens]MBI5996950.1 DNA translocase FtsK [Clostridium perfringens]
MAGGKKKTATKTQKKKNQSQIKVTEEIYALIAICVSLIVMFSLYTDKAGYLSVISRTLLIGFFGIGAFFIPIYIIYLCTKLFLFKREVLFSRIGLGITIALITSVLLIQTVNINDYYVQGSIWGSIKTIWHSQSEWHGGVVGFLIVLPLYKLVGKIGLFVIFVTLYLISSMLIFDYNLVSIRNFFGGFKEKASKVKFVDKKYEKDDYINLKKKDGTPEGNKEAKKEDTSEDNNKIKILDFMKNSSLNDIEDNKKEKDNIKINDFKQESKMPRDLSLDNTIIEQRGFNSEKAKEEESIDKEISNNIASKGSSVGASYVAPNADLLNLNNNNELDKDDKKALLANAAKLEETLMSFGVEAKILQVTKGPSVTRFELQPKAGIKVSKIVNLADDIALGLAAKGVRIEAPIPGKSAIGIEVPNKEQTPVFFREIVESKEFLDNKFKVACALGKDITGKAVVTDLSKMPHVLIAGATGSGKSVCINTLIVSILYKYSPDEVKLLMVDPKVVELNVYNGIPHLLIPVVTDPKKAAAALNWAVNEMTRRYKLFADNGVRNIESYNALYNKGEVPEKLPYIVIIVDELADLMMACPHDVEDYICRLAQMARAAGMHLVIATQRPSVDVITGVIKANIPSRISFAVSSQIDSRTILDSAGAEKLLGRGDMLFYPVGESKPQRVQGAFISEEEVEHVVSFIKESQKDAQYEEDILEHINSATIASEGNGDGDRDELLDEAIEIVVESGQASASYLQRRLRIGFNRAARIIEELEECGVISRRDGSKPRQVLLSKDELENMK